MAKVLFIKRDDLVRNSVLSGNIDSDKFLQFIEISQEIHLQNYLGTKLYDKLRNDIINATLTPAYETLLDDYVQPMLIHWAMVEYLPHAAYTIGNGGAYKHDSCLRDFVRRLCAAYVDSLGYGRILTSRSLYDR